MMLPQAVLTAIAERLIDTALVLGLSLLVAGLYFTLGRLACPARDRLPLSRLTAPEVWATIVRGWDSLPPPGPRI